MLTCSAKKNYRDGCYYIYYAANYQEAIGATPQIDQFSGTQSSRCLPPARGTKSAAQESDASKRLWAGMATNVVAFSGGRGRSVTSPRVETGL